MAALRPALALAAVCFVAAVSSLQAQETARMTQHSISNQEVLQFLTRFEQVAEQEDFSKIEDMIHERAFFRFNDGDFIGRDAIRAAFEKTWRGSPGVKKDRFYLTDITVLSTDRDSASATYTWHWEGVMQDKAFRIQGRGTRVLIRQGGRLQIIHEHLSRFPKAP
jgi:hypothetical protein